MSDPHMPPAQNRLFFFERQEVVVQGFDSPGPILDIGGGGEGIIGRLKWE